MPGRFWLRLGLWLAVYLAVLLAWGVANSWPPEFWASLLFTPVSLAVGAVLYRRHHLSWETPEPVSQWGLLISFLLLAVGVASGLVFLMALGWLSLGEALLRPARANETATEDWFKLPLLFLFALPVFSDLAGERHDLARHFAGGELHPGCAWPVSLRMQVLPQLAVLILALGARGIAFGAGLLLLPWVLLAVKPTAGLLPAGWRNSPVRLESFTMLFVPLTLALLLLPLRGLSGQPRWTSFTAQILNHAHSPWLAVLVVVLSQSSLVESWQAGNQPGFDLVSAAFLLLILLWLRWRTSAGPVHLFSQILLTTALFVLLAAEWTDLNPLRHAALGFLLVGALSWRRAWSWPVLASALATWVVTLPATPMLLIHGGIAGPAALSWCKAMLVVAFVSLLVTLVKCPATRLTKTFHDAGWRPVKRFALLLLLLLTAFQGGSALLAVFRNDRPSGEFSMTDVRLTEKLELASASRRSIATPPRQVELIRARPFPEPARLRSPELCLESLGFTLEQRKLVSHARGQAVTLQWRRGDESGVALCWFQNGERTFTYLPRARRILWSGWNLNRRDLQLVILTAANAVKAEDLARLAEQNGWFLADETPSGQRSR